eukprot:43423-Eustigmatos_ZCMA.PRE.1
MKTSLWRRVVQEAAGQQCRQSASFVTDISPQPVAGLRLGQGGRGVKTWSGRTRTQQAATW